MNNKKLNPKQSVLFLIISFLLAVTFVSCDLNNVTHKDVGTDSVKTSNLLSKQIFFLLHQIENSPSVAKKIKDNHPFNTLYKSKKDSISSAIQACQNMDCLVKALILSDDNNQKIISSLSKLYHNNSELLTDFMRNKIRPSRAYAFYANYSDSALLIEAWKEQRKGLNYIFHAYLQNKGLIYPSIDSAQFYVQSPKYLDTIKQIIRHSLAQNNSELFFDPLLDIGIKILLLNGLDEAIRFVPLSKVNHAAYAQIPTTDWKDYPYSSILVFGEGPKHPGVAISPGNKKRCSMGAVLYRDRKAPFIVVSGGYVHPYQTKFNEALEMKEFMMDSLNIPEEVIIMEPHARHTTSNIRNTNRILLSQAVPRAKPILGVTSKAHIDYIVSDRIDRAFKRDFGMITYVGMKRLSDTTASYYPTLSSFQINTRQPLDP